MLIWPFRTIIFLLTSRLDRYRILHIIADFRPYAMSYDSSRPRRNSRSRDRWRRRSPEPSSRRSPEPSGRPFTVFPTTLEARTDRAFKLTPNPTAIRQEREQDLHTWRQLDTRNDGRDLPPLIRRNTSDPPEVPPISFTSFPDGRIQYDMHCAPPEEQQEFFLNAMRIVAQPHQQSSNTTPPINLQIYPTARRQLRDAPPNTDPPFIPLPSSSTSPVQPNPDRRERHLTPPAFMRQRSTTLSESGTETERRRSGDSTPPGNTGSTWTYQVLQYQDGKCIVQNSSGTDANPIHLRFITNADWPGFQLPCSEIPVPWLGSSTLIREYKHCQENTTQMQHFWIQEPYCWLYSDELVAACKGNTPPKEFWFKLWHALDKWKLDANKNKNRLLSGHELPPLTVPTTPLDTHLMQLIVRKIADRPSQEELRQWQTPLNTLCAFLAKWPAWSETIDSIFPHHYKSRHGNDRHILICYYGWTDAPILKRTDGQPILSKNYCWGHATNQDAALQIALSGGIRPSAIVDEKDIPYHWTPSFYCRIDGSNIHATVNHESYIKMSIRTIQHTRSLSHLDTRPFIFHGVAKCRQESHLRLPTGGVPAEYTASLFYDVIHGHDKRWLVRSHLSTLMGFSV